MPDPVFGRNLKPGSLAQLSRFTRGWNDQMANFLLPLAFQDIFFKFYDFDEDTITSDWTVANSAGTSAADFAAQTSAEYGAIKGDTGTTDNGSVSINYDGVFFDAARNPGMLVRIKFDTVTDMYFEAGFSDAPTNAYAINVSDVDTPALSSNGLTDIACVVVDTDQTLKSAALVTKGTTDAVAKSVMGASPGSNPFTAATYATVLIQCYANAAYAVIDGNAGLSASIATGMDTAIALRPHVIVATRSTTAVFPEIDYIALWSARE